MNTQAVREAIAVIAKRQVRDVTDDKRLTEDLGIRSLARLELAAIIDEKLGTATAQKAVAGAKTVGELLARLTEKAA